MKNKTLMYGMLAAFALSMGASSQSSAAVLVQYDFVGGSLSPTSNDPNTTGSDVSAGAGFGTRWGGSSSSDNLFVWGDVTPDGGLNTSDYFQFTISPSGGYEMDLDTLTFNMFAQNASGFTGTNTTNVAVRSEVDTYAVNLASAPISLTSTTSGANTTGNIVNASIDLSGVSFQDLTAPVTFRIYVWDNTSSNNALTRIDSIVLNGAAVIPEPGTPLLFGLGALALVALCRRKSRAA